VGVREGKGVPPLPNRLSVTGVRGKSTVVRWLELILRRRGVRTLAKVTGYADPHWIHNGEILPIKRINSVTLIDETLEYRKYPHDILIAENQGISAYTMRVYNDIVKPDTILVTNIRLDHTDTMGETKQEIAESIGCGFTEARFVVSGEEAPDLNQTLQRHASRVGASFIQASSPTSLEWTPTTPLIGIIQSTLSTLGFHDLTPDEVNTLLDMIHKEGCLCRGKDSVIWFDGAKINDPESADQVLDYLMRSHPEYVYSIVGYLRSDRPGRTKAFLPWFHKISKMERIKRLILAGYGCRDVANRIGNNKATAISEKLPPDRVISLCAGSVIFLACNAVNTYMINLKARLAAISESLLTQNKIAIHK